MKNYWFVIIAIIFSGCIESFDAEFVDFESAIVVEGTITNELKQQTVYVTRTFEFEAEGPTAESNADVKVVGGGAIYTFTETIPGTYRSSTSFAAQPGIDYQLLITTEDGRSYSSDEAMLTPITTLDEVRAERVTRDTGEDGIAILANSFDPSGNSVNYRYTYEETYRVIAPEWNGLDLIGDPDPDAGCNVLLVPKQNDERICYPTDLSNSIILTNTSNLGEDRVDDFMVRFINRNNYIISHRYSILVKQHVQSNTAFTFYETLSEFSGDESLFTETQPGFLEGNISSDQSAQEKVLGFFDVASVTEKRIFFNYSDFYPNEPLPPYVEPCVESAPVIANMGGCVLRPIIENNLARFSGENPTPADMEGPFFIVPRVCGDCTVLGSTEIPNFWTE